MPARQLRSPVTQSFLLQNRWIVGHNMATIGLICAAWLLSGSMFALFVGAAARL